ncbi:uncharacterized protein LOC131055411 [Cryptomeria japonica]|uniref:uncharacterized protein LOC131055411 n=1 Tax=Cryptomeria japonica TaxID=3369 RepID=UPI0027D9E8B7|nr:uncharacterized protein LOC131055411 [Cryptomeria japonica]
MIVAEYARDPWASGIVDGSVIDTRYTLVDDLIIYKSRIFLVPGSKVKQSILRALHDSPTVGHPGYFKTYRQVWEWFTWKGLKSDVLQYVRECPVCQQNKQEHTFPAGLLQPLPIPDQKWECISMDFITGFPKAQGYDCIYLSPTDGWTDGDSEQVGGRLFEELRGWSAEGMGEMDSFVVPRAGDLLQESKDIVDALKDNMPYKQSTLKKSGSEKLKPRYYEPFRIIKRVGELAYELELPADSRVHNVFHVLRLKKALGQHVVPSTVLPPLDDEGKLILVPESILDSREK